MKSKQSILDSITDFESAAWELPPRATFGITYDDPIAQFSKILKTVGGTAIRVPNTQALLEELATLDFLAPASNIYSAIPEFLPSTVDLAHTDTPQQLHDLDVALVRGELAVAENGAVWVTDELLRHRVVLFIAEHVILIVSVASVLQNLHEAYEQLSFGNPQYGVFISGPSKTADIEQSLVFGAQGPRTLTVFLLDEEPDE